MTRTADADRVPRRWPLLFTVIATGVWVRAALGVGHPLDYHFDAKPGIDSLTRLDVGAFLHSHALMGAVTLIVRAPFVALAGGDEALGYRLGALPCVAAMSALLFVLLDRLRAERHSPLQGAALAALFAANPLVVPSLAWGHPEELFTGALCVLAVLAAGAGRTWVAGIALGLALASKQWALLALLPVLLAAPARRGIIALTGGAIAAALTAPMMLSSLSTFAATTKAMAGANSWVAPPNAWWPLHATAYHRVFDGVAMRTLPEYTLPAWANALPHPLILIVGAALAAGLWRAAPRPGLERVLALLALVLLLRCVLDPWNNVYYHVPFLLALFARDAVAAPRRPLASASATVLLWLTFIRLWPMARQHPDLVFAAYMAWTTLLGAWLATSVFAPWRLTALAERRRGLVPAVT